MTGLMDLDAFKRRLRRFAKVRDWEQFHSLDLRAEVFRKLAENARKYPARKVRDAETELVAVLG